MFTIKKFVAYLKCLTASSFLVCSKRVTSSESHSLFSPSFWVLYRFKSSRNSAVISSLHNHLELAFFLFLYFYLFWINHNKLKLWAILTKSYPIQRAKAFLPPFYDALTSLSSMRITLTYLELENVYFTLSFCSKHLWEKHELTWTLKLL